MSFLGEIKRRKVFQVAAVYAVVAWLIIQVADVALPAFEAPAWVLKVVIFLAMLGFPITLIMSWTFDLTPDGVVKDQGAKITGQAGNRRIEYVLVGLVVVALGWLVYRVEFDAPISVGNPPLPDAGTVEERSTVPPDDILPNSIAVLPFANQSPDPDNDYLAAGIYQSTVNQLGKIGNLTVIARTSVMQFEKNPPPVPEIAKALKVAAIMEGSVQYANGQVLITAQLIDGRTGRQLWSDGFKRELTDVFAVQGEVAEQIATAMQVQLLPEERARIESRPTESAEAYEHYLRALSLPWPGVRPEYWSAWIDSLERAIAADPEFAEAYAELARGYNNRGETDKAVRYAQKAIELDPSLGDAYQTLGDVKSDYYARQEEAEAAFARAVELSPNNPYVLDYRGYRLADNRENYAEAIRLLRRAVALEPTEGLFHSHLGFVLMRSGKYAEATEQFSEAIEIDPVNYYTAYLDLATVGYLHDDHVTAKKNLDRALEIMSSRAVFRVDYVAYLYGLLGDANKATELMARFDEVYGDSESQAGRTLGWGILGTRDKEKALRNWTNTINAYIDDDQPVSPGRISRFRDNWLNDPMLEEPEFLELRRRLGFKG